MKLKVLFRLNCESSKYIAKLFSLSILILSGVLHLIYMYIFKCFSLQYKVNINAFNVAINPIIMSPTDYSSNNTKLKLMGYCCAGIIELFG